MQIMGYSNLLCSCPKYEHHIWKMESRNWNSFSIISFNPWFSSISGIYHCNFQ